MRCPAARDAMVEVLEELQKPTKQRRISASQLARLVVSLTRPGVQTETEVSEQLKDIPISLEQWNYVRRNAESKDGVLYDEWRNKLSAVSEIQNEIILDYIYLARSTAHVFGGRNSPNREDYENQAIIGMIRALDAYKPHLEIKFSFHAYNWILSHLTRFFEKQGTVHLSEPARRVLRRYQEKAIELANTLNREPSLEEIATAMNMDPEKLSPIVTLREPTSLDAEDPEGMTMYDVLPGQNESSDSPDVGQLRETIRLALTQLPEPEKMIVNLGLEMNLHGVTPEEPEPLYSATRAARTWLVKHFLGLVEKHQGR